MYFIVYPYSVPVVESLAGLKVAGRSAGKCSEMNEAGKKLGF